ncbi:MAG: LL-diaminopimelate aminotransferase [Deltaproteobacteria bacterium]|nr:LL-diaminopimelate aminotransferase [Deltaproteobacteria bacterium]
MTRRNPNLAKLQGGYLFPEINRRKMELLERDPAAKIIGMDVGNTTQPLTPFIAAALSRYAAELSTPEGYSGYGHEQGLNALREEIAKSYYRGLVAADEVFVSDGAKCDIGRLQLLFGAGATFAVQDPSYPVYVDGGVIMGQSGDFKEELRYFDGITYWPCTPENNFFPDLQTSPAADLIYWCSPNNPTGAASTKLQLQELVKFARTHRAIIIFDAAYAMYIQDPALPRSIFEIEGAREVAIEVNSFSKMAGFTGVRLAWTVVPRELCFEGGEPVITDWNRIMTTIFNGASNIAQHGGLAALSDTGQAEVQGLISFYMENAALIKGTLEDLGVQCWGGKNAPYVWARFENCSSWQAFEHFFEKAHIVTTPGVGFGPSGEGFLRFSAFGQRHDVEQACERLQKLLR